MRSMLLVLTAIFGLMQPAMAQSSYDWIFDAFTFPVDRCGEPSRMKQDMPQADIEVLNQRNEEWRQCQLSLQDADKRALRILITSKLGGQWETRGSNFAWVVASDCNCDSDVNMLINEMSAREQNRQRANQELMADTAATRTLEGVSD